MKDIKKEQDSIYEKIKEKAEIMRLKQNIEKYLRGITEIYDKDVLKKLLNLHLIKETVLQ